MLFSNVGNNILVRQVSREPISGRDNSENTTIQRRTRRRYTFWDEDCESHDELINSQEEIEYSDFRTYPLNINWKDLDSLNNDSYEIKQDYGLIGVFIYFKILGNNKLGDKSIKITPTKFIHNLIEFYFENYEKGSYDSLLKIIELLNSFPENEKLSSLIKNKLILKKEILLIKLILDLKLHYHSHFDKLNLSILNSIFIIMKEFYKNNNNEKLRNLYDKIKEDKIFKKYYNNDKLYNFPKKSNYFSQLKKIRNYNKDLFGGIEFSKFCL